MSESNAWNLAISRLRAAEQAIADRLGGDATSPVNASFTLTGKPTFEDLEAEVAAANAAVDAAAAANWGPK